MGMWSVLVISSDHWIHTKRKYLTDIQSKNNREDCEYWTELCDRTYFWKDCYNSAWTSISLPSTWWSSLDCKEQLHTMFYLVDNFKTARNSIQREIFHRLGKMTSEALYQPSMSFKQSLKESTRYYLLVVWKCYRWKPF